MKNGKVKFYNESKGYGFIKGEETDEDIFVHATGLLNPIKNHDVVKFELVKGKRGLAAINVQRLEAEKLMSELS